jgi:hypothetical protein
VNPLQGLQGALRSLTDALNASLSALNPVPEPVRFLFSSRAFWLLVWLGVASGAGRSLLGPRLGPWAGAVFAAYLWWVLVPGGAAEVAAALGALVAARSLAWGFPRTAWGRRLRGVRVCPRCAEEVRARALACRYCGEEFAAR